MKKSSNTRDSTSRNLNLLWTHGLKDEEQIEKFTQHLVSLRTTPALRRLKQILKQRLDTLRRMEESTKQYDHPNWNTMTAHNNGQRQELGLLLELLTFVED